MDTKASNSTNFLAVRISKLTTSMKMFFSRKWGVLLLIFCGYTFLQRIGLQSINYFLFTIFMIWLIVRLFALSSWFLKEDEPGVINRFNRKRMWKLFGSLSGIFVIFIILSATIFLNFSDQVGGNAQDHDSPHYKDGTFHNLLPTQIGTENVSFFSTAFEYLVSSEQTAPTDVLPTHEFEPIHLEEGEISVTWFAHSTILVQTNQTNILMDPIFGKDNMDPLFFGPSPFPFEHTYSVENLPRIDHVLISHDHYDHLDMDTIKALKGATFHVPLGVKAHLVKWNIWSYDINEYDWYDSLELNDNLSLTLTPSQHFSGRGLFNGDSTLWGSWVIEVEDWRLFFSGDSGYSPEFKTIGEQHGPFDLAFVECGQYNEAWSEIHMFPDQTVQAAIDLQASAVLPIHNSKYELALHAWDAPLEGARNAGIEKNMQVVTPMIGQTFLVNQSMPQEAWWHDVPDVPQTSWVESQWFGWLLPLLLIAGLVGVWQQKVAESSFERE